MTTNLDREFAESLQVTYAKAIKTITGWRKVSVAGAALTARAEEAVLWGHVETFVQVVDRVLGGEPLTDGCVPYAQSEVMDCIAAGELAIQAALAATEGTVAP